MIVTAGFATVQRNDLRPGSELIQQTTTGWPAIPLCGLADRSYQSPI